MIEYLQNRCNRFLIVVLLCIIVLPSIVNAIDCNGTCDVTTCDFLNNLCLNNIDLQSGGFDLPDVPCEPLGGGIFFEILLFCWCMIALAIVCDDHLCPSLERLCEVYMIREDVAGATFMAFGSAAPEIIINVVGTFKQIGEFPPSSDSLDATNLGVGAILGSGMIAFLVIPGACALFTDNDIHLLIKRRPLLRDIVAYAISLLLLCVFMHDGIITALEGSFMVIFYFFYVLVVIFAPSIRRKYRHRILARPHKARKSFVNKKNGSGNNANPNGEGTGDQDDNYNKERSIATLDLVREHDAQGDEGEKSDSDEESRISTGAKATATATAQLFGHAKDTASTDSLSPLHVPLMRSNDSDDDDHDIKSPFVMINGDGVGDDVGELSKAATWVKYFGQFIKVLSRPATFMFEWTIPNCEEGGQYENWYPLSFAMSFIWVALFSTVISSCVVRWTTFTPAWAKGSFFGLVTIAIGAEIPDMIASVTMARRGYGSMAVSNALGSQIINIAIGLGLPWLLATLFQDNGQIQVTDHNDIQVAAYFQFGAVFVNFMMLLGTAVYYKQNKALLTKDKGGFLVASYFGVIICYICFMLYRHSGAGPCDAT